jgi:hypothetical protein
MLVNTEQIYPFKNPRGMRHAPSRREAERSHVKPQIFENTLMAGELRRFKLGTGSTPFRRADPYKVYQMPRRLGVY